MRAVLHRSLNKKREIHAAKCGACQGWRHGRLVPINRQADLKATSRGLTNAIIAVPMISKNDDLELINILLLCIRFI
jgi:hypothetical protein